VAKKRGFDASILKELRDGYSLAIRAGSSDHRFIRLWVIVVQGRVFVRSWGLKPKGWYRTFLEEPRGAIAVKKREIPVRAVAAKGERLNAAIDRAYMKKYATGAMTKYARDLVGAKCRATTTELLPA
jgi:hypothetical protein